MTTTTRPVLPRRTAISDHPLDSAILARVLALRTEFPEQRDISAVLQVPYEEILNLNFLTFDPITDRLGGGSFSEVYRAKDEGGNLFAIKNYRLGIGKDNGDNSSHYIPRRSAFLRESHLLQQLGVHSQIPDFYGVGAYKTGDRFNEFTPALVMQYIDGKTLADYVTKHEHFSAEELHTLFLQALEPLEFMHHGVTVPRLHRDIKPENFKLNLEGTLFLLDFGSARHELIESMGGTLGVGTSAYTHPEQLSGNQTCRTDLYSLGKVFYALAIGRTLKAKETVNPKKLAQTNVDPELQKIIALLGDYDLSKGPQTIPELRKYFRQPEVEIGSRKSEQPSPVVPKLHDLGEELGRLSIPHASASIATPLPESSVPAVVPSATLEQRTQSIAVALWSKERAENFYREYIAKTRAKATDEDEKVTNQFPGAMFSFVASAVVGTGTFLFVKDPALINIGYGAALCAATSFWYSLWKSWTNLNPYLETKKSLDKLVKEYVEHTMPEEARLDQKFDINEFAQYLTTLMKTSNDCMMSKGYTHPYPHNSWKISRLKDYALLVVEKPTGDVAKTEFKLSSDGITLTTFAWKHEGDNYYYQNPHKKRPSEQKSAALRFRSLADVNAALSREPKTKMAPEAVLQHLVKEQPEIYYALRTMFLFKGTATSVGTSSSAKPTSLETSSSAKPALSFQMPKSLEAMLRPSFESLVWEHPEGREDWDTSRLREPCFSYDESLERLRAAGYERHPRPDEMMQLLAAGLNGTLHSSLRYIFDEHHTIDWYEWLSIAAEVKIAGKKQTLITYRDPVSSKSNASELRRSQGILSKNLEYYSEKREFDITGIPLEKLVDLKKFPDDLVQYFYGKAFTDLPEKMKYGQRQAQIRLPYPNLIVPGCNHGFSTIEFQARHPEANRFFERNGPTYMKSSSRGVRTRKS